MSASVESSRTAWQPLTPAGVAAFAGAPAGRLLLAQLVAAALCAAAATWFVSAAWMPVAREAVARLPRGAGIRHGVLSWTTNTPVRLAENRFLALVVDARNSGMVGRVADIEIALQATNARLTSILGSVQRPLPGGWIISLDPTDAIPWWGAREAPLRALVFLGAMAGVLLLWWVVAAFYCPAALALALLVERRLSLAAGWRLSGAALMPGALLLALGLVGYGALGFDLIRLGLVFVLHLATGWVYLVSSSWFLPKLAPADSAANPFAAPGPAGKPAPIKRANPFAPPD